jgi:hypothetical protein
MEDPEDCAAPPSLDAPLEADAMSTSKSFNEFLKLPQEIRNIIAGGIAGMVAKSVVAPMDRIKILYQISSAKFQLRNVPKVAYTIVQTEGISALWKGNTATLIRVFPYAGIQFMVFDRCKTYMLHQHEKHSHKDRAWGLSPMESLLAGSTAGVVSVIATYPLDLTRAQLAVLRKHRDRANMGFRQVLFQNYERRGTVGLFRGITPTLLGILPYSGIAFALNDQGKRKVNFYQCLSCLPFCISNSITHRYQI